MKADVTSNFLANLEQHSVPKIINDATLRFMAAPYTDPVFEIYEALKVRKGSVADDLHLGSTNMGASFLMEDNHPVIHITSAFSKGKEVRDNWSRLLQSCRIKATIETPDNSTIKIKFPKISGNDFRIVATQHEKNIAALEGLAARVKMVLEMTAAVGEEHTHLKSLLRKENIRFKDTKSTGVEVDTSNLNAAQESWVSGLMERPTATSNLHVEKIKETLGSPDKKSRVAS